MDQELSVTYKRKQAQKTRFIIAMACIVLSTGYYGFYSLLTPSVKRSAIETAIVETGPLEATLGATGVVIPEFEQLITSPIQARIQEVLHTAGEEVEAGEAILTLDKEYSLIALDKLKEEQELNRNKILQLQLSLQKSLDDLHTQNQIKKLKIKSLEAALADEIALKKIGGSTTENIEQAGMNLQIARLEAEQLHKQILNQKEAMAADLKALSLQIRIQEKTIQELESKISAAGIKASRRGVITWISDQIGSTVNAGSELVRLADLSSFKVEGSISESYAEKLKAGTEVLVRVNGTDIRGRVMNVNPSVENGIINFLISLEDKSNPSLRPQLKVDVLLVTSFKEKTIRVKNSAAFDGSLELDVFVVKADQAYRRKVKVGESNVDYVEILSGLTPGEEIISSDISDYKGLEAFTIK